MSAFLVSHRAPRRWLRITLAVPSAMSETIAGLVAGFTGCGVEIEEGPDANVILGYRELPAEKNMALELEKGTRIGVDSLLAAAGCSGFSLTLSVQEEEDWDMVWKQHFSTFQVTPRLVITPSWEHARAPAMHVIELDPGQAFGTGHHQSTRLALRIIDELFLARKQGFSRVLDVGCGTGILGMAAALFGAKEVLALDNDPDAVAAAGNNISHNSLDNRVEVSGKNIAALQQTFDLIMANITHDTLVAMAPQMNALLASGGYLVLAGILKDGQEESCRKRYEAAGFHHCKTESLDEWSALLLQKDP